MPESIQLTRQQLYDLVWSKPVVLLAKDWNISGVGLAKLCRRHKIPLPYRGYWARIAAGQTPRTIKLLAAPAGVSDSIRFTLRAEPKPASPADVEVEEAIARDTRFASADKVPDHLRRPHPLVSQARSELAQGRVQRYGRLKMNWKHSCCLNINVCPPSARRALQIAEGIIKGAIRRCYEISQPNPGETVQIIVGKNSFGFSIEERTQRREIIKDPKKLTDFERRYPTKEYEYDATGELTLKLGSYHPGVSWSDKERRKLETRLPEFFQSLAVAAVHAERRRLQAIAQEERRRRNESIAYEYKQANEQLANILKDNGIGVMCRIDGGDRRREQRKGLRENYSGRRSGSAGNESLRAG